MLLVLCSLLVRAQSVSTPQGDAAESFSFEHYGQTEGLSQGTGYAIAKFDDFMWIGTQDGLNRFDGYGFRVFRAGGQHALSNSFVQTLLADSRGQFWVGTGAGLNRYQTGAQQFDTFGEWLGKRHQLDTTSIKKLIEDRRHNLWVMTDGEGLFRVQASGRNRRVKTYFAGNNALFSGCTGPDGGLWIAAYDTIYRYDAPTDQFLTVLTQHQLGTGSPIGNIMFDKAGDLWIGTRSDGVFLVKSPTRQSRIQHFRHAADQLSSNETTELVCDRNGRVWIGSRTGGISIFDPVRKTFAHHQHLRNDPRSLAENSIWSLFEDPNGALWFGFSGQGIAKYDPRQLPFRHIRRDLDNPGNSLPDAMIFRLAAQGNDLFIGMSTGGLARYSLTTHRLTSLLPGQVGNEVRVITPDAQRTLWLANWQTLSRYDPVRQTVRHYPTNLIQQRQLYVYAAHALTNQAGQTTEVWTGGNNGLHRFDVPSGRWITWASLPALSSVANYTVRLLYADQDANVWIGTLGHGLYRYNRDNQTVQAFNQTNGLSCANIRSLLQTGQTLWVGTDCGLYLIDLATMRVFRHYTKADGLPNEVIYGILADDNGDLWLSSNQGLTRFSPVRGVIKNYDVTDGLQSNEFNTNVAYKHPDGTLFFGGVNGITYFKPSQLGSNSFVPPVRITGISVLDSAYNPNQEQLTLSADENFVEFTFAALNFSNAQKNQYQYRLEGIDPSWVRAGHRRTVNYTKLPPGEYVFRVKGSNDDGVWNEQGASVRVTINPPFWATWWFRLLLISLLMTGIYGVYRYRIAQLKSRQAYELAVSVRTQELERQRFSKELHDGVGANLAVLKMYLSSLGSPAVAVEELKARSLSVLKSSIDDIRSIIHDMHPRSLSEEGLASTIADMVALMNESHRLAVTFEPQNVPQKLPESLEINLFRVVQELMQNAVKHAGANAIWLCLRYEHDTLQLTYRDDGRGFTPLQNGQASGNGLINIEQRVALMKGTYQLQSAENQGTTVEISVPVTA
ncbi:sensor histidine kinase [Spirosoma arcticum]